MLLYPELETPVVIVRQDTLDNNIARMARAAKDLGFSLRPHCKTHKSLEIARRQLAAGASGLTVAKVSEAEVMQMVTPPSILVANQIIGWDKAQRLIRLNQTVPVISGVDSTEGARFLNQAAAQAGCKLTVSLEINTGLHRAGVLPGMPALTLARELVQLPNLHFWGIFTHAGHAYAASDPEQRSVIGRDEGRQMVDLAQQLRSAGVLIENVSVGSTPTALDAGAVAGVTEVRPGNYVFYDAMQIALGVATEADCALRVITTVISRPTPTRAVVDCGSKTLALDRGAHGTGSLPGHGRVLGGYRRVLERLSEEHGVLRIEAHDPLQIGDRLEVIPNHACVVVNLTDQLVVVAAGKPLTTWNVQARGCTR